MKKNILLLINGFGIEQKDSVEIYSDKVMPNMDKLTKTGIFGSISSKELDYADGYRYFSIGVNEPLTYSIINNSLSNDSYINNEIFKYIINDNKINKGKIHIICYLDSESTLYQLGAYIKSLVENTDAKIFIHLILRNKSLKSYKFIEKTINSLNYEYGVFVKVGIVSGERYLQSPIAAKDYIKMLVAESGEKWKEIGKKLDVLIDSKTIPADARTFAFDNGFGLSDNDSLLFFNYTKRNITSFTKELVAQKYKQINLSTIKFYSLFPVDCENLKVPNMYNYAVSSTYLLNSLKQINAKCLVMDKKDRCSNINYYLTGLRNTIDNDLRYMPTDNNFIYDSNSLINVINNSPQELIIINYELNDCKTIEEIIGRLHKIDTIIGVLYDYTKNSNFGLFISSLYGMEKELYNEKHVLCKVNFSVRVPVVIVDSYLNKKNYVFREGNIFDLSNTLLHNINAMHKDSGVVKKKSALSKMFFK